MSASIEVTLIESHHLIRERQFNVERGWSDRSVERALHLLNSERATGKLIVNFTSGAIGSIQFEERAKITSAPAK